MLQTGTPNQSEAALLYKLVADKGNTKAMFMNASIKSTENSYREASQYYKMAADLGDVEAILSSANMLDKGEC